MKSRIFFIICVCSIILTACQPQKGSPEITLKINDVEFTAEIADTPELQEKGLMDRKALSPLHGMLFTYKYDAKKSFWMKNTYIPLSIAFIASDGTIKEIYDMKPLSTSIISSKFSVRYALEVNQGEFEKNGISAGDRVIFPVNFPR